MEPIMKWAGGKRQLLDELTKIINIKTLDGHRLYEPFVGGGALFLSLEHNKTSINDLNQELINVYIQIKNNPEKLIECLQKHKECHSHSYYYKIRNYDRTSKLAKLTDVERAARTIYLNRVCYNGLYRVNSLGQFNVPMGKYSNPEIVFEDKILEMSKYFNQRGFEITSVDFEIAVSSAKKGDIVYFDPPYDYDTNGFASYTKYGFTRADLIRLKKLCDALIARGCKVVISNNDTSFVRELFNDRKYHLDVVLAKRMINCIGEQRDNVKEVIIYG